MDLTVGVYNATMSWPPNQAFGLTSQGQRSAVSVMANIAEGKGRTGAREFLHHLSIADGSLSETESHLLLAHKLMFIDDETLDRLLRLLDETRGLVRGLIRSLR